MNDLKAFRKYDFMIIMDFLIAVFFLILIAAALSIVYWTYKNGISPMPTSPKIKAQILQIPLQLRPGKIYELGSGWGSLAFALAKKFPNHHVIGYETSWIPFAFSLLKNYLFKEPNLTFKRLDFYHVSLQDASLVVCYLFPLAMQKLKVKFYNELPKGCFVISNTFSIPNCQPIKVIQIKDLYGSRIYVYLW